MSTHHHLQFTRSLQGLFANQAREVAYHLSRHQLEEAEAPDLAHWAEPLRKVSRGTLLTQWHRGMIASYTHIRGLTAASVTKGLKHVGPKMPGHLDRRVIEAVDAATLHFSQDTIDTTRRDVNVALEKVRDLIRRGMMMRKHSAVDLAKKIQRIFHSPARAYRIAVTEMSRALNGGRFMVAQDMGVRKKRWRKAPDACKACRRLNGRVVLLERPFAVLPEGGIYGTIMYPPYHPFCKCSVEMVP